MSFRWLASLVGVKAGPTGKVGIRRKAAPQAQRDLANEIGAHALQIRRTWVRGVNHEGRQRRTVIVRVDPRGRRDIEAWLTGPEAGGDAQVFSAAASRPETGDAEAHAQVAAQRRRTRLPSQTTMGWRPTQASRRPTQASRHPTRMTPAR